MEDNLEGMMHTLDISSKRYMVRKTIKRVQAFWSAKSGKYTSVRGAKIFSHLTNDFVTLYVSIPRVQTTQL